MKNMQRETSPTPEEQTAVPKPPRIFELIAAQEPEQQKLEKIIAQIYSDFYTAQTDLDRERVVLGFLGLLEQGSAGRGALENAIARDTGELGGVARKFVLFLRENVGADEYTKRMEIENLFGIKRHEDIIDFDQIGGGNEAVARRLYATYPALQKRFVSEKAFLKTYRDRFTGDYEERQAIAFLKFLKEGGLQLDMLSLRQKELLFTKYARDKDLYIELRSVGGYEPSYYELLGPMEILRMRQANDPRFLLIGAFDFGAQEFMHLADKISKKSKKYIIDINKDRIPDFNRVEKDDQSLLSIMDGLQLGFHKAQLDYVFSNFLLKYLENGSDAMRRLLGEVYKVLKPGGSFLLTEFPDVNQTSSLIPQAQQIGFIKGNVLGGSLQFMFTHDRSSSSLDSNGFAHYEHAQIVTSKNHMCLQLVKAKQSD